MFGRQNDQSARQNDEASLDTLSLDDLAAKVSDRDGKIISPAADGDGKSTLTVTPAPRPDQSWSHPGTPLTSSSSGLAADSGSDSDSGSVAPTSAPAVPGASQPATTSPASPATDTSLRDLQDIKQHALNSLSPLIDKLDQSPEDHFRTLMMMIQGSDNQSLIKEAYAVAQSIKDEKIRAQALLDIVNEINYFSSLTNT